MSKRLKNDELRNIKNYIKNIGKSIKDNDIIKLVDGKYNLLNNEKTITIKIIDDKSNSRENLNSLVLVYSKSYCLINSFIWFKLSISFLFTLPSIAMVGCDLLRIFPIKSFTILIFIFSNSSIISSVLIILFLVNI